MSGSSLLQKDSLLKVLPTVRFIALYSKRFGRKDMEYLVLLLIEKKSELLLVRRRARNIMILLGDFESCKVTKAFLG